jgi:hypothetical protein
MGSDYSSVQVFADNGVEPHSVLVERVAEAMDRLGYVRAAAIAETATEYPDVRRIAVGPAARWVTVYDSASRGEWDAVGELAARLSVWAPTVHLLSTDHWFFSAHLYRDGERVDVYSSSPTMSHEGDGEPGTLHGVPALWRDLVKSPDASGRMWRALQASDRDFRSALDALAGGLGWNRQFSSTGFWETGEGDDLRYTDWLDAAELAGFVELCFRRSSPSDVGV